MYSVAPKTYWSIDTLNSSVYDCRFTLHVYMLNGTNQKSKKVLNESSFRPTQTVIKSIGRRVLHHDAPGLSFCFLLISIPLSSEYSLQRLCSSYPESLCS